MKRFFHAIGFLLSVHLMGLLWLSLLRFALYLTNHAMLSASSVGRPGLQAIAFVRGLWFDNVIACYILIVPLVILLIGIQFKVEARRLYVPLLRFMQVLYAIAFAASAANIAYFQYFFKNINSSIFNWFEYGFTTLGMVLGEWSYYPPILLFIILVWVFIVCTNRSMKWFARLDAPQPLSTPWPHLSHRIGAAAMGILLIGLCIFGIRGRTGYNPIKISAAYYCQDAFLNQLGVNAAFNLLTSTLDEMRPENRRLTLMDGHQAVRQAQAYLQREGSDSVSPLYRYMHNAPTHLHRPNVVIILMESMSANLMQSFGQKQCLTPFLDSLYHQSIAFTQAYSAGIHTNHGLYATLYSWPAIMKRNLMKGSNVPLYSGLPTVLKQQGYRNLFFMTHESQYDNMNAFFRTNGFHEVYSQENYPADKVVNSFGVQDDFLYAYSLPVLDRCSQSNTPFFATLLSISNHPPYVIPSTFHPRTKDKETQIVEYADWSLRQFFLSAQSKRWFHNTVFVLLGDHGKLVGQAENEMPACFNHIPLMIYSPQLAPQELDCWATQMDIQPTLLSLMGISAPQNNFGVNLLSASERRPAVFYTADDMIGARTPHHLYCYRPETHQTYFYQIGKDGDSCQPTTPQGDDYELCKNYVFSMLQAAEQLVGEGKTTCPEP